MRTYLVLTSHQVTGNDVSGITVPGSAFADAANCAVPVQRAFAAGDGLVVYRPGVTGPLALQPDFVTVPDNATHWLCLEHAPPA